MSSSSAHIKQPPVTLGVIRSEKPWYETNRFVG
jgi:hypothetical protein